MSRHRNDWLKAAYPGLLNPLRKYLRRFVPYDTANDLAHDAFLRVYASPDFPNIESPRGYLFRTARNLALNAAAAHAVNRVEAGEKIQRMEDERACTERQAITDEVLELVDAVISGLPPQRRRIVILRFLYGYSVEQIADQMNVSLRTVYRDLAKALRTLNAARKAAESDGGALYPRLVARRRQRGT